MVDQSDFKVFIDYGHDTIKACRVNTSRVGLKSQTSYQKAKELACIELDHIEIPTQFLHQFTFRSQSNSGETDFKKDHIERTVNKIVLDQLQNLSSKSQIEHMEKGLFTNEFSLTNFNLLVDRVGQFLQSEKSRGHQNQEDASYGTSGSTLLITDGSQTMAGGDQGVINQSQKQRAELSQIAFEELGVDKFGITSAQAPMLFSKMVHHGFVIDLGHEMTQIVPIKNGHVSYH